MLGVYEIYSNKWACFSTSSYSACVVGSLGSWESRQPRACGMHSNKWPCFSTSSHSASAESRCGEHVGCIATNSPVSLFLPTPQALRACEIHSNDWPCFSVPSHSAGVVGSLGSWESR